MEGRNWPDRLAGYQLKTNEDIFCTYASAGRDGGIAPAAVVLQKGRARKVAERDRTGRGYPCHPRHHI